MHNIFYEVYKDSEVKTEAARKKVQRKWDAQAARDDYQEGCHGLPGSIKWRDDVAPFDSEEKAQERIEFLSNNNFYYQCAFRFTQVEKNATLEKMEKRLAELKAEVEQDKTNLYYSPETVKAKYITCKHCGSKLSVAFLKQNDCPLCHEDLRPATIKNRAEKKMEKLKKLAKEVKEYSDSHKAIYWLVKVEYHT